MSQGAPVTIAFDPADIGPVAQSFWDSDDLVRCLIGPVGSAKSSLCVNEILRRALEQRKGPDGLRRSRAVIIRNCYDPETEILTEHRGWVRFPDLNKAERVAALHGDHVEWEVPTFHYEAPYSGDLIGVRSQSIDLLVTPNHHLWASPRRTRQKVWGEFQHVRAEAIEDIGELWRMRATAEFPAAETEERSEAFFEFLGFWFAEGYAAIYPRKDCNGSHYRLIVTQKLDPWVDDLLQRAGFEYGVCQKADGSAANYTISTKDERVKRLIEELAAYGHATDKWLPRDIIEAPKGHVAAFLRGYHRGDGSGGRKNPERPEQYHSRSKRLLDGVHEMLVRQGRAATLSPYPGGMWALTALCPLRSSPVVLKEHWRREHYEGPVYCVEVSSHVVLVRRNGKAVWCGQTYRELEDTTRNTWSQWFEKPEWHGAAIVGKWRESDFAFEIALEDARCEVLFRALDGAGDERKLLSLELTFAYVNEAKEIRKSAFDVLRGRIGRYPSIKDGGCTWRGIWMDTNPPDTDHWIYKTFEEERPERTIELPDGTKETVRFSLFKQPSGLGPQAENIKNLDPGYYARQMIGATEDWIRIYLGGEYGFAVDGKPIYPEWQDANHRDDTVVARPWPIVLGQDFGLTPAAVLMQRDPRDGQWQVFDELVSEDMGAARFAAELHRKIVSEYPGREFTGHGDPAGEQRAQTDEQTPYDFFEAAGVPLSPAPTNDWTLRREAVAGLLMRNTMMGRHALVVGPKCKVLRKAMKGGYCFKRLKVKGADRFHDKPDKNEFSHVAEALQYACVGEGEDQRALDGGRPHRAAMNVTVHRAMGMGSASASYRRAGS